MRVNTELLVNLKVLEENYQLLRQKAPQNRVIFMVKANAYGHGLCEITTFAFQELGVASFGVASIGEAKKIRKDLPELKCDIFVFSDLQLKDCIEDYAELNIIPVISSLDDLSLFLSQKLFLPLVFKFDTGMHRLGIEVSEIEKLIKTLKENNVHTIHHVMTHFSSSYLPLKESDKTHRQYQTFKKITSELKGAGIDIEFTSCANSGAIEQQFSLEESYVRPGLMLYGPASTPHWQGKNISSLKTNIIKEFLVKKGTPIGYGAHVCHRDGKLLYLPLGYGDGILTHYSGADFQLEGHAARILGRVNMDLLAVLVDEDAPFKKGEIVRLWSHDSESVSHLAHQIKSIPYQILTAITDRIPRKYAY